MRSIVRACVALVLVSSLLVLGPPAPSASADEAESFLSNEVLDRLAFGEAVVVYVEYGSDVVEGGDLDAELDLRRIEAAFVSANLPDAVTVEREMRSMPMLKATIDSPAALSELLAAPGVVAVHGGFDLLQADVTPLPRSNGSVPGIGDTGEPALDQAVLAIGADHAQARGNDGAGVRVAVIDSGVDLDHPAFDGRVAYERCIMNLHPESCPNGQPTQSGAGAGADENGHGTSISAAIVSTGAAGVPVGVAPAATLDVYRIYANDGPFFGDMLEALDEIYARNVAAVVNLSIGTMGTGGAGWSSHCDDAPGAAPYSEAVSRLRSRGIVTTSSAGNLGVDGAISFPACLKQVVAVGATVNDGPTAASFSNLAPIVDVTAPGENIVTASVGGGAQAVNGTSVSSAVIAGCVAVLNQAGLTKWTEVVPRVKTAIVDTERAGVAVPWVNCGFECQGSLATVHVAYNAPTSGSDVVVGTEGADVIDALDGDDLVCARGGDDVVDGGLGSDELRGDDGHDDLDGGDGDDDLVGGKGDDELAGGAGDDVITGNDGADVLRGGDGADLLRGRAGKDELHGDAGDDILNGNADGDDMFGGDGNDTLNGDGGWDELRGDAGDDIVNGDGARDTIYGGSGADILRGGAASDVLRGSQGDDDLAGNGGDDTLKGGQGIDTCALGPGVDTLFDCEQ